MSKKRLIWLGLVMLSLVTFLVMGGCGGSSSSSSGGGASVAKVAISGTINFPSLNSLVGKQVSKSVQLLAAPTIELRNLSGNIVKTTTATGTGTVVDPFIYSFSDLDGADYVIKAYSGSKIVKALVDKNSLVTATTRNIDTVSTTTIIVAEKKLGATLGTLGEVASAVITSTSIANTNPTALENTINTAINTVQYSATTATPENIDLVNLVNVVAATVNNNVDPAKYLAGSVSLPSTVTTTQYTVANVTTGGTLNAPIVQATVSTILQTTASTYTAPPVNSVSFIEKVYDYNSNSAGIPMSGVTVTTVGLSPEIATVTDVNGLFVLSGIPQSTSFYVKMGMATYANAYSNTFYLTANQVSSDRPYALWLPTKLTNWGNSSGNGVIRSKVVTSTDQVNGYIGGAVVTATDKSGGTTYPVKYIDSTGAVSSTLTSTDASNGNYLIVNVPAGHTVDVTATKSGFTFNTRTFTVQANGVSESRITGTAVVVTPTTSSAVKAYLQSGWFEVRNNSSYNQATSKSTNYFYINKIGLAADGITMTNSNTSYLDPVTKTWTSSVPTGFPSNNNSSDYALTSSGTWVLNSNGPQGYTAVFNADGSARITDPISGSILDVSAGAANIAGQNISSSGLDGALLLSGATTYPSGSVTYNLTITNVNDSYTVWNSNTSLSTLASVPAAYASSNGPSINVDYNSTTDYIYANYASGSSTTVNIFKSTLASAPLLIGTATASTVTAFGQQLIEITIPANVRSTYQITNNPIFAVVNGVVMQGSHSLAGFVDSNKSSGMFNDIAINHIKANINTALAKPAVAKSISNSVLGW